MTKYIDREAFMQSMYHEAFEKDSDLQKWDGGCWIRYKLLENVMSATPPADVRPVVRGKWIWKDNGEVVCSECNDLIAVVGNTEDLETVISGFNLCPNCGADMREPPKEE